MWLRSEKHTLTQGQRWAVDHDSCEQDLQTNKQVAIASAAPNLLCHLAPHLSLTYRLDDEEHGTQKTGGPAKTQLQILFKRADDTK